MSSSLCLPVYLHNASACISHINPPSRPSSEDELMLNPDI